MTKVSSTTKVNDQQQQQQQQQQEPQNNNDNQQPVSFDVQMESILELMTKRAKGEVTTEQVENAVSGILSNMGHTTTTATTTTSTTRATKKPRLAATTTTNSFPQETVKLDNHNYDEDDDDNDNGNNNGNNNNDDDNNNNNNNIDFQNETQQQRRQRGATRRTKQQQPQQQQVKRRSKKNDKRDDDENNDNDSDIDYDDDNYDSDADDDDDNNDRYNDILSQIPMGMEGAKMMTTFGDGPKPIPDAVRTALLGARTTLQLAIMDARAIRRRVQKDYYHARQPFVRKQRKNFAPAIVRVDAVNPKMLSRAYSGYDRLGRTPKCGFDMEQLTWLFPEEMRAYQQWNEMHTEYSKKTKDNNDTQNNNDANSTASDNENENESEKKNDNNDENDNDNDNEQEGTGAAAANAKDNDDNDDEVDNNDDDDDDIDDDDDDNDDDTNIKQIEEEEAEKQDDEIIGGHLQERAANFDVRTDKMKSDWYLKKFSQVRKGSFLPKRRNFQQRSEEEIEWDSQRNNTGNNNNDSDDAGRRRGRRQAGIWDNMSPISIRFLHWLGFDPPMFCPPNEETTQALAFLGYDMFGKIVEKAVFLRNLERMRQEHDNNTDNNNNIEIDETNVLWELKEGEQLSKQDIENALKDPDVRPGALHKLEMTTTPESSSATTTTESSPFSLNYQPSFQLYFGPGFEERLELEMEELLASTDKDSTGRLSEEEQQIRKEEAKLFSKISAPPTVTDALTQILEQRKQQEQQEQKEQQEQREREQQEQQLEKEQQEQLEKEQQEEEHSNVESLPKRKKARLYEVESE